MNWRDQVNDSFSYSVGGNVTFNKNEVTALNGGQAIRDAGIGAAQGFVTYTDNGQAVGTFHVLQVIGVFNTADEVQNYVNTNGTIIQPNAKPGDFKYLDKNGDGRIDDDDRVFAGSYLPQSKQLQVDRWTSDSTFIIQQGQLQGIYAGTLVQVKMAGSNSTVTTAVVTESNALSSV